MKFKLIVCVNEKNVIGRRGSLLFHIKNDLKNFKRMTTDNVVIMGRKTFESLPNKKPLPNRINIIMTNDLNYYVEENKDVFIVHNIKEVLELCEAFFKDKELFVIGGGNVYNQFIENDLVDEAIVTRVNEGSLEDGDITIQCPWERSDNWKIYYESYTQRQRTDGDDITYKFIVFKKKS